MTDGMVRGRVREFFTERLAIAKDTMNAVVSRGTQGGPVLSNVSVGPIPVPVPSGTFWEGVRARRIANRRRLFGM